MGFHKFLKESFQDLKIFFGLTLDSFSEVCSCKSKELQV